MNRVALMIVGGTVLFGASLELAGCDDSSTSSPPTASSSGTTSSGGSSGASSGGSSGGSSGTAVAGPTLGAADKQDVGPCPNQEVLTNATEFGLLITALQTGTITYLDEPYNAGDPDTFKKKCG